MFRDAFIAHAVRIWDVQLDFDHKCSLLVHVLQAHEVNLRPLDPTILLKRKKLL